VVHFHKHIPEFIDDVYVKCDGAQTKFTPRSLWDPPLHRADMSFACPDSSQQKVATCVDRCNALLPSRTRIRRSCWPSGLWKKRGKVSRACTYNMTKTSERRWPSTTRARSRQVRAASQPSAPASASRCRVNHSTCLAPRAINVETPRRLCVAHLHECMQALHRMFA
jgi:hypothetical protein